VILGRVSLLGYFFCLKCYPLEKDPDVRKWYWDHEVTDSALGADPLACRTCGRDVLLNPPEEGDPQEAAQDPGCEILKLREAIARHKKRMTTPLPMEAYLYLVETFRTINQELWGALEG
jgi:hypothetical protein